jgi:two-component system NtrC family sensor kinase
MTPEIQRRVFDPFFTTKAPGVGTGLGLSLSYGIISRLGGTIECRSEVGVGTEFVISFPGEREPPGGVEKKELSPALSGRRV